MTWEEAEPFARSGVPVRRAAWSSDASLSGTTIVFSAGAGTTRAVAVFQRGGSEAVERADKFGAADFLADDWELVWMT